MMFKRKVIVLALLFSMLNSYLFIPAPAVKAAQLINIDPGVQYQTMDGWGTSLAWWAGQVGTWSEPTRKALMDLIFGSEGLNLNIVRYNIGGSDDPANNTMHPARKMETLGTGVDANGALQYDWTRDAGQRWVLTEAMTNPNYNVNFHEAQVNSPPYWMTVSGSGAGNIGKFDENLAPDKYDLYVDYLIGVLQHFKQEGIVLDHLDPFNEPASGYWVKGGSQEGSYFSPATQQILINKLKDKLAAAGLTTQISASDETSIDQAITTYNSFNAVTKSQIHRINTHDYSGSKRYQLRDLALSEDKPLWQSEISTGYVAHDDTSMKPAIPLANIIFKDLKDMGVNAWMIWQAVEDEVENFVNLNPGTSYGTPWNPPGSWGLIHAAYSTMTDTSGKSFTKEQYSISKQYYVMQQFSKFIKQGYTIIEANHDNVLAAMGPDGEIVLVVSNFAGAPTTYAMDLSKFDTHAGSAQVYQTSDTLAGAKLGDVSLNGSILNAALPANSLTTFIINDSKYTGAKSGILNDNVLGDTENKIHYNGSWSYYDGQEGAYSKDVHYTNAADNSFDLKWNGNRVKLHAARSADSGIAQISIDGGAPVDVDTYSALRQDNALVFDSGVLDVEGAHTISVKVTWRKNASASDSFIAFDRAIVTKADTGDGVITPKILSVTPRDASLTVTYQGVPNATAYHIQYGTESGKYPYSLTVAGGTTATIPGLTNGTTYYVVVTADAAGAGTVPSAELQATPLVAPIASSLIYYVDAGGTALMPGNALGDHNSELDQQYGEDPVTGYKWGWTAAAGTGTNSSGDRFQSVRYAGTAASGGLSYKFEVPNGKYNVSLGFSDPWGNAARKVDIKLQNVTQTTDYVAPAYPKTDVISYSSIRVVDGVLQVDVFRTAANTSQYTDALISWIRVERYDYPKAPSAPYLTSVDTTVANQAKVQFIEAAGAENYKVRYGNSPNVYTNEVVISSGLEKVITGLSAGTPYYFAVTGLNTFGESASSNEVTATTKTEIPTQTPSDLMYYTVLGASGLPEGKSYGWLQGAVIDPTNFPIAKDPSTGYTWGMTNRSTIAGAWVTGPYGGFGYTNNKKAGEGINYSFEVPNGQYNVTMGFYDPWNVAGRNMDIMINGAKAGTANALTSGTQTYPDFTVTNHKLTVDVVNPTPTENQAPGLSMIQVDLLRGLAINRKAVTLTEGDTLKLETIIKPSSSASQPIIWSSSNPNVVTAVYGVLKAQAPGTAIITAAGSIDADFMASTEVTVVPNTSIPVTQVTLDNKLITALGDTKLTAVVTPSNATNPTLIWTSDDPMVATVVAESTTTNTAVVTAVGSGVAKIRVTSASDPTLFATAWVDIPVPVSFVALNADRLTLAQWQSALLHAVMAPLGAVNATVSWQSSNPAIATVDSTGIVKAVANGTAMITATVGGVSATCAVIVRTPVTSIQPQTASITLIKGETMSLMTTVLPSNATNKSVIWNSNKSLIANVDANGIVTGKNFGAAIITATSSDGYFEAEFLVKVAAIVPLTGVTITPSNSTLKEGAELKLIPNFTPVNATVKKATWQSDNIKVATVDQNGLVKGKKKGVARITITTAEGAYQATAIVTVVKGKDKENNENVEND